MACSCKSVSLYYDVHGKQTGEFRLNCTGEGCPKGETCAWVEKPDYAAGTSAIFCHCTPMREDGWVEHFTHANPPGRLTPCEGSIGLLCVTKDDVCELEPHCFGGCEDDERQCTLEQRSDEWHNVEGPGKIVRRVRIVTYKCACKRK